MPPLSALKFARWFLLAASAFLAVACATGKGGKPTKPGKPTPGSKFVVSVPHAAFYKYGPAQTFGPDFQLVQGQKVALIERSFGFSKVMTQELITGYVSNDELQPAPPEPVPLPPKPVSVGAAKTGAAKTGGRQSSAAKVESLPGSALFDVSDLPAPPLPENSEPKPEVNLNGKPGEAPKFKY